MKCAVCGSTNVHKFEYENKGFCENCGKVVDLSEEKSDEKMRVFFSYGHDEHSDVVNRLKEAIEARSGGRIEVWIDHKKIPRDSHWRERITKGILECQSVLAFLSSYSTRERGVCLDELAIALVSKHGMLRTILLEPKETTNPPPLVSEYQWGDMSNYPEIAAQGEAAFQEYINKQADSVIDLLNGDEIKQYGREISYLREKLGLPEISPLSKFDLLVQKPMIGRKWLNEAIEKWVDDPSSPRAMMIYGNPGVGKSMYAAHLQHYNPHSAAAIACEYQNDEYNTSDKVTIWLAYKLALRLPDYRRWLIRQFSDSKFEIKSGKELVDQFLLQPFSLGMINGDRSRYFIIIDALDEARAADFSEYLLRFINETGRHAPWLRFVITAREEPHIIERFGRFPAIRFDENLNNNSHDIREYYDFVLKPLLTGGKAEIDGRQFTAPPSVKPFTEEEFAAFADRLTEASRGVFVYAEKVCGNIADDFINGRITTLTAYPLPDGIRDLFRDTLDRKFNKESEHYQFAPYTMRDFEERFSEPLGMVTASQKPLPAATLISLMGWSEKEFNRFMFCFGTVLDEKDGCLIPFHKSFAEWLNTTRTRYNTPISDGVANLAQRAYQIYQRGIDRLDDFLTVNLTRILRSAAEQSGDREHYNEVINDEELLVRMCDIGDHYKDYNRFTDAGEVYTELIEIFKVDITEKTYITIFDKSKIKYYSMALRRYGDIMIAQFKFIDAEYYFQEDLDITTKLAKAYPENPDYKRGLTIPLERIADIKKAQNDLSAALKLYEEDLQIARELEKAYPENPQYKSDLSVSLNKIADIKKAQNDLSAALKLYQESRKICEELAEAYPENPQYKRELSVSLSGVADIKRTQNDLSAALKLYQEALQIARAIAEAYSENPQYNTDLSVSLKRIADIKQAQNDLSAALKLYKESLDIMRKLEEAYPEAPLYKIGLCISLERIADIKQAQNDLSAALKLYEESYEIWKELAAAYPENPLYKRGLSVWLDTVADIKKAQNDLSAALKLYEESRDIRKQLTEAYPENPDYKRGLSISLENIADIKQAQNDLSAALTLYEESRKSRKELAEAYPENPQYKRGLAGSYYQIADLNHTLNDIDSASAFFQKCLDIMVNLSAKYPRFILYLEDCSDILEQLADIAEECGDKAAAAQYLARKKEVDERIKMLEDNPS